MKEVFFDLSKPDSGMNYRWIQPPQVAYFITTVDSRGNPNTSPVTLGTCVSVDMDPSESGNYYYAFSLGYSDLPHVPPRQSQENLKEVPECVLSYIGSHLFRETQVAGLPLPRGISEIEVMGLTELPSKNVRPPGIRQCRVNIELQVVSSMPVGEHYQLHVGKAVGVSVDEELLREDAESDHHAGVYALNPWFELTVLGSEKRPPRIHMIQLDPRSIRRLPDHFGPAHTFVGSFENWLEDEQQRGRLTPEKREEILKLNQAWQENPDPIHHGKIKDRLTELIKALIPSKTESSTPWKSRE